MAEVLTHGELGIERFLLGHVGDERNKRFPPFVERDAVQFHLPAGRLALAG